MKSRLLLFLLFCVTLCSGAHAGDKSLYVEFYWPPKDRTKWNKALTAVVEDIERSRKGTLPVTSLEKQNEAMLAILAENGFKPPKGTFFFLNRCMGGFVVQSDKLFHRKLTRGLGLQVKPDEP